MNNIFKQSMLWRPVAWAVLIAWMAIVPTPAFGQGGLAPAGPANPCYEIQDVLIEIDATGVANWRFTNRRRPFPVVKKLPCGGDPPQKAIQEDNKFDIVWDQQAVGASAVVRNTASGNAVVLTVPYEYQAPDLVAAQSWVDERVARVNQELEKPGELAGIDLRCPPDEGLGCIRSLLTRISPSGAAEQDQTTEQQATAVRRWLEGIEISPEVLALPEAQPLEDLRQQGDVLRSQSIEREATAVELEKLSTEPTTSSERAAKAVQEALDLRRQADELDAEAERLAAIYGREFLLLDLERAILAIDPAKLSWNPPPPPPAETPAQAGERLRDSLRRVQVALSELGRAEEAAQGPEPPVAECQSLLRERQKCAWTTTLYEGGEVRLDGEVWRRLTRFSRGVIEIHVQPFDESRLLTNRAAYLRVRSRIEEPGTTTSWKLTGDLGYEVVPEIDRNPADMLAGFFTTEEPYDDGRLRKFTGTAKLELNQTFGSIAEASVTSQFKSGDLGEATTTRTLVVPLYHVKVTGLNGMSLLFGKRDFAVPGAGIAISESGEGFQLDWQRMSFAHLVKRESLTGTANDDDQDTDVSIVRARVPLSKAEAVIQAFELTALRGENNTKDQTPYEHWTVGVDAAFGDLLQEPKETWSLTGRLAGFYSEREAERSAEEASGEELPASFISIEDGSGLVWLVEGRFVLLEPQQGNKVPKARRSFTLVHARGDGDDPETTEDEGYIGETSGFVPDRLFLRSLAATLREPLVEIPAQEEGGQPTFRLGTPLVRGGLSNKSYYGLAILERERARYISPLDWIARWLGLGSEIKDQGVTLAVHAYRLEEPLGGRTDAGLEADVEFRIQVPQGINTSLAFAQYWPGNATRPFIEGNVFSARAAVSVSF
jgi:hypothetical protein